LSSSSRKQEVRLSLFRYIALIIFFIMFVAFSFLIYDSMRSAGYMYWWQFIIPICFVWLVYLAIVYSFTRIE
jgi:hypothetical protein